jgi:hypothetical protein
MEADGILAMTDWLGVQPEQFSSAEISPRHRSSDLGDAKAASIQACFTPR